MQLYTLSVQTGSLNIFKVINMISAEPLFSSCSESVLEAYQQVLLYLESYLSQEVIVTSIYNRYHDGY